ncbi:hypothetical protein OSL60_29250, partial [Escherichia coli]|nr:hypothetical protein [Escherichia coli]
YDGVILFQTGSLQVTKEGSMIAYGRIAYEKDDRKEKIAGYWTKRSSDFKEQHPPCVECSRPYCAPSREWSQLSPAGP